VRSALLGEAGPSIWDRVVDGSNVVGAAVTLFALLIAYSFSTSALQVVLLRHRRSRTIGRRVRTALRAVPRGQRPSRRAASKATKKLLKARVGSGGARVLDELSWLSELFGARQTEALPGGPHSVPVPFSFAPAVVGGDAGRYQSVMADLALGYAQYGALLRKKWLLRSAAGPLVRDEYECALATAELIERHGRYRVLQPQPNDYWISMRARDGEPQGAVRLIARPDMRVQRTALTFPSVAVSYQPYRVAERGRPGAMNVPSAGHTLHLVSAHTPRAARDGETSYDGIMTRLHGAPGFRVESDPHSGRQRLHLCLAETSFWAFQLTQWDATAGERDDRDTGVARLLSVNLLLMDDAEYVLLVRRAKGMSHGSGLAGAASGAPEVVDREGIRADVDGYGIPDPVLALVREGQEELGIDLSDPEWKLGVLGLVQVRSPNDVGTYVLTGLARLPAKAADFRLRAGDTDDVEGTWELGSDAVVVDVRGVLASDRALREFVNWLRSAEDVLPHALGAFLLLLTARLEQRSARGEESRGASLKSLREAIDAAPPSLPVRPPRTVRTQPLWAGERDDRWFRRITRRKP
jgi:8-oxo-dGTP pyrophosphatase MutT (NUDIX family)